jgi:Rab-GTPase-TBC domain
MSPRPRPTLHTHTSVDSLQLTGPSLTPPADYARKQKYPDISRRRSLFRRISHLNSSFGARERTISTGVSVDDEDHHETDLHWEAIERVLFIYAKLNPAIGYVQGMNELIAPLYYVSLFERRSNHRYLHKMT